MADPIAVQYVRNLYDYLNTWRFVDAYNEEKAHESTGVTQAELDEVNSLKSAEPGFMPITLERWNTMVTSIKQFQPHAKLRGH